MSHLQAWQVADITLPQILIDCRLGNSRSFYFWLSSLQLRSFVRNSNISHDAHILPIRCAKVFQPWSRLWVSKEEEDDAAVGE